MLYQLSYWGGSAGWVRNRLYKSRQSKAKRAFQLDKQVNSNLVLRRSCTSHPRQNIMEAAGLTDLTMCGCVQWACVTDTAILLSWESAKQSSAATCYTYTCTFRWLDSLAGLRIRNLHKEDVYVLWIALIITLHNMYLYIYVYLPP